MSRAYIPLTSTDRDAMLATIGVGSVDELFAAVPAVALGANLEELPDSLSELELVRRMQALSELNTSAGRLACFRGGGVYRRFTPAIVDEVLRRGEFPTSYTPYQAEASQ